MSINDICSTLSFLAFFTLGITERLALHWHLQMLPKRLSKKGNTDKKSIRNFRFLFKGNISEANRFWLQCRNCRWGMERINRPERTCRSKCRMNFLITSCCQLFSSQTLQPNAGVLGLKQRNRNITCTNFLALRCFEKRGQRGDCRAQQGAVPEADWVRSLSAAQAGVCSTMLGWVGNFLHIRASPPPWLLHTHTLLPHQRKGCFQFSDCKACFPNSRIEV